MAIVLDKPAYDSLRKQYETKMSHNMALNRAPLGCWTLRDKAAQRRLALHS